MIRACQVHISCRGEATIWNQPREAVREKIHHCLKLSAAYRRSYEKTKVLYKKGIIVLFIKLQLVKVHSSPCTMSAMCIMNENSFTRKLHHFERPLNQMPLNVNIEVLKMSFNRGRLLDC